MQGTQHGGDFLALCICQNPYIHTQQSYCMEIKNKFKTYREKKNQVMHSFIPVILHLY